MKIEELRLECLRLAQSGVTPSSADPNIGLVLERARAYVDFALGTQGSQQQIDKDGFAANYLVRDLERFVKDEGFHFGDSATEWYFEPSEATMDIQWEHVQSFLAKHPIDYTSTMELACGHGRNTERLANLSRKIVLVDVHPENILFCQNRFANKPWTFVINNGFDLREIPNASITFVYCFEAAVHFDIEIIVSYIKEFRRVMTPGAFGFVHHSNVTAYPGRDYRTIPHGRNFMSKEIFTHLCVHNGLEIVDQHVFNQGGPEADCFSLFWKNAQL
jgi:SAM-dependent methyltransferase